MSKTCLILHIDDAYCDGAKTATAVLILGPAQKFSKLAFGYSVHYHNRNCGFFYNCTLYKISDVNVISYNNITIKFESIHIQLFYLILVLKLVVTTATLVKYQVTQSQAQP